MAKCEYKIAFLDRKDYTEKEYICPHTAMKRSDDDGKIHCIFHSMQENKEAKKFFQRFKKLYEDGKHDFTGFVFPKDFKFFIQSGETKFLEFKNASFREAKFLGEADFEWAAFLGISNFEKAKFTGITNFYDAQFLGLTFFIDATFSGTADFRGALFLCDTYFSRATFSKTSKVIFRGETFDDSVKSEFLYLKIEKDADLTLDRVNLKQARLLGTDLEKINFKEVYWRKSRGLTRRNMLFDETHQTGFLKRILQKIKIFYEDKENYHYEVQNLYNKLRLNYENTGRYHEAGDFFVGAMEMRKKGTRESIVTRLMLFLYKYFSLYGEQPIMAFFWILFTPFLFIPLYLLTGLKSENSGRILECNLSNIIEFLKSLNWEDIVNTFYFSLNNLALGKYLTVSFKTDLIPLDSLTNFVILLENVVGLLFITLFILAMNRKFRRTKD